MAASFDSRTVNVILESYPCQDLQLLPLSDSLANVPPVQVLDLDPSVASGGESFSGNAWTSLASLGAVFTGLVNGFPSTSNITVPIEET